MINVLYSVEWGGELEYNLNELTQCRYKMKQIVNCNSDKVPIRFPLFMLLVMLKMFDTTFVQNILLRFPRTINLRDS